MCARACIELFVYGAASAAVLSAAVALAAGK